MKHCLFLSFFYLFAWPVAGQNLDSLQLLLNNKSFDQVNNFLKTIIENDTSSNYQFDVYVNRQIIDSFTEKYIWYAEELNQTSYHILLLTKNDRIIFCKMTKDDYSDFPNEILILHFKENKEISELQKIYKATYNRNVEPKDFYNQSIEYGNNCVSDLSHVGNRNYEPWEYVQMKKLVEEKNISELNDWLRSPIAETQIYAIDGFYQLKKNGYTLTDQEFKLINIIKLKLGTIRVCGDIKNNTIEDVTSKFQF